MTKLYKSLVKVGNVEKLVVAMNWKKEEVTATEQKVDRLHHIHVLDRSYSMSWHLKELIENVKSTFDNMANNDLLSVVWFSGEGQCKILLKGSSKSDSEDVKKLLDTIASPVGCTCFSEPLEKVNSIVDDLAAICPNFNVTFFTDGETVTHHSTQEEEKRIFVQIDKMKDRIMALNTIGYGSYYNKKLLEAMADKTMFGKLVHSSQIGEYSDIWSHTYEIVSNMIRESVNIEAPTEDAHVLYLSSKTTKLSEGKMELKFLDKVKNQFFILLDPNETSFTMDEEVYNVADIKGKIPKTTLANFYYAYAYELYYKGNTAEALDVLVTNLGDKYAIDQALNSFTAEERQKYQDEMQKFIFRNKTRYQSGEVDSDYLPAEDAFCVMDLLKILSQGDNFYVPVKNYARVGLKVTDTFNLFESNNEMVKAPFKEFVFNAKHLNLSIRYMVNGTVKINPKQAKTVGLDEVVDSRIFRNQTLIKDGNLNIKQFEALVDSDTLGKLVKVLAEGKVKDTFYTVLEKDDNTGESRIEISLSSLPVINRKYQKEGDEIQTVLDTVKEIETLKAYQKVVKHFIDVYGKINPTFKGKEFKALTPEAIDVLEQHGLNAKFDYQGVNNKASDKNEEDYYLSRLLEFKLKGWSSLPKVDDVIAKIEKGAKMNAPTQAMAHKIEWINENELHNASEVNKVLLENELISIKDSLSDANIYLNTIKMAKVLTGSWWEGLEVDAKSNYVYEDLLIKNDRIKKFF